MYELLNAVLNWNLLTLKMMVKNIDNLDENWQAHLFGKRACVPKWTLLDSYVCFR